MKTQKLLPTEIAAGKTIVPQKTCFGAQKECGLSCKKSNCRYWIDSDEYYNCSVIASSHGPMTLQEIGDVFGVTRMRICQIEKSILGKLEPETEELA